MNWDDSQAYVQWLSTKTGRHYRLLSEAEWEYAARAGTTTAWYWGDREADQCRYANAADVSAKAQGAAVAGFVSCDSCDDKYAYTSPVGSFLANSFDLYDMGGNVGEWVKDCYHDSYSEAPTDGSPVEACIQKFHNARVMRGGGWNAIPAWVRSASRDVEVPSLRSDSFGLRVATALSHGGPASPNQNPAASQPVGVSVMFPGFRSQHLSPAGFDGAARTHFAASDRTS